MSRDPSSTVSPDQASPEGQEPVAAPAPAAVAAAQTAPIHPVLAALRSKNPKMAVALASQCTPEEILAIRSGTFGLLHEAALRGDAALAKLAIKSGADPLEANKGGWFPLLLAAAHPPVVELLLAHKADANQSDPKGLTALAGAFSRDSLASAKMLLDAGANPDGAPDANWPPLFSAAASSDAAVEMLEKKGAKMDIRVSSGRSALHAGAAHAGPEAIERLARAGVGLDWTDVNGDTALHLATRAGNELAAQALVALGAHPAIENLDGEAPQDLAEEGTSLKASLAEAEATRGRKERVGKRPTAAKKAKMKAQELAAPGEESDAAETPTADKKTAKAAKPTKPAAKKAAKPAAKKSPAKTAAKKEEKPAAKKAAAPAKAAKPVAKPAAKSAKRKP